MNLKIEDLRKGNFVEINGEIVTVNGFSIDGEEHYLSVSHEDGYTDEYHISGIKPLTITDEWLKRLKFDMSEVWKNLVLKDSEGQKLILSASNNWFVLKEEMEDGISNEFLLDFLQSEKEKGHDLEKLGWISKKKNIVIGNIIHVHILQNIIHDFYQRHRSLEYA